MCHYRDVVIETFKNKGGASRSYIRAKPLEGQGLDVSMNVECSSKMRKGHPIGTKFLLQAKVTDRDGGSPFLYAHYNTPYRVVSKKEASEFINKFKV